MEARQRVRAFLLGAAAEQAPFFPFAIDLAARMAQRQPEDLFADPGLLTDALLQAVTVFRFDCAILRLRPESLVQAIRAGNLDAAQALPVVREAAHRLQILLGDRAALALVLPGPRTLAAQLPKPATPDLLEDVGGQLLEVAQSLGPPALDIIAVLESEPVTSYVLPDLTEALTPLWNAARYYSLPTLFICARADAAVTSVGASAVTVWQGATPADLLAAGASRVGLPVRPHPHATLPPPLPGGFYMTAGEIPGDADPTFVQELVNRIRAAGAQS